MSINISIMEVNVMSIGIKTNKPIPPACHSCFLCFYDEYHDECFCALHDDPIPHNDSTFKFDDCPLFEISD